MPSWLKNIYKLNKRKHVIIIIIIFVLRNIQTIDIQVQNVQRVHFVGTFRMILRIAASIQCHSRSMWFRSWPGYTTALNCSLCSCYLMILTDPIRSWLSHTDPVWSWLSNTDPLWSCLSHTDPIWRVWVTLILSDRVGWVIPILSDRDWVIPILSDPMLCGTGATHGWGQSPHPFPLQFL